MNGKHVFIVAEIGINHNGDMDIAKKLIDWAAHAFGIHYKGKGMASYGDASMLSFHATKVFNTIEGGAVCFRDPEIGKKLYQLKNFGIQSETEVTGVGANAKMNEFQAAMGLCNLRHVEEEIAKRQKVFERYMEGLQEVKGIKLPEYVRKGADRNYAYFPVVIEAEAYGHNRDEVYNRLKEYGIYSRRYFYPLTNEFSCFHGRYDSECTPVAHEISEGILCLPIYADLEMENVDLICNTVKRIQQGQ